MIIFGGREPKKYPAELCERDVRLGETEPRPVIPWLAELLA
jgi:hypothetical protein